MNKMIKRNVKMKLFLILILFFSIDSSIRIACHTSNSLHYSNMPTSSSNVSTNQYQLDLNHYDTITISRMDILVDTSGNIYTTGVRNGVIFVEKHDKNGKSIWNYTHDDDESAQVSNSIAIDALGNIYITGYIYNANNDMIIIKLDDKGQIVGMINWDKGLDDKGECIALDYAGNIFVVGDTYNGGDYDAFIAIFDTNCVSIKNISWGDINTNYGNGITVDGSGNIFITGYTQLGMIFETFIAKYNIFGDNLWNATLDGVKDVRGFDITVDRSGNVYITGTSKIYGDYNDAFFAKFDSDGNLLKKIIWDGFDNHEFGKSIVVDTLGNIYITGYIDGFYKKSFIAKFDSNGFSLYYEIWGETGESYNSHGIVVDDLGNIYCTGIAYGSFNSFIFKYCLVIEDDTPTPGYLEIFTNPIVLISITSALGLGLTIGILGGRKKWKPR